jgi:outer membrane protein OmpA-like peptidoglycan-associated protein
MQDRKRDPQSRTLFVEELKKSDPKNAQALATKFGNPVKVKELEKWLAGIGVGFPVHPSLANETMSDIRKYQNKNYEILQGWLVENGKKAKENSYEKLNKILTKKEPLTIAEIEQMDKDQLFEKDKEALTPEEKQQLDAIKAQIEELDLTPDQKLYLQANSEALYGSPSKDARPQF